MGMAREGLSTAEFLLEQLPEIDLTVTDHKKLEQLDQKWGELLGQHQKLRYLTADQIQSLNFEVVFKTPGIPHRILTQVYGLNLAKTRLCSNTQLFFDLLSEFSIKPVTIGVTGTKGKSTTTAQIFHVLSQNLANVYLAGNIGVPPLRLLQQARPTAKNIFVLEMSCHQLADLTTSPQMAVALDISPDHLDYYPTFEDYFQAKTALCRFQKTTDLVFFNQDSKTATKLASLSPGHHRPFSLADQELLNFITTSQSRLVGEHNLYNTLPAILIARKLGVTDEQIRHSLSTFQPVPHRLELVRTVNHVSYYDDSASSAPEATVAALESFADHKIVLIAGGSDKGVEFDSLATALKKAKIRQLILFPTTGEKILAAVLKSDPNGPIATHHQFAQSMPEAVQLATQTAQAGDVVLLSPACASYNMFNNYEDRGNQFKDEVEKL